MFFQTDIHLYELLFVQIADHFLDELVHCLVYKTSRNIRNIKKKIILS